MVSWNVKSHRHVVARPGETFSALGATWLPLPAHADSRGWFAELWKTNGQAPFVPRQVSLSQTHSGITKAFHYHQKQQDLFIPLSGAFRIVLLETKSPHHGLSFWWREGILGMLHIPAGLAHGYRVEGSVPGQMLYLTSETYNPQDEGRMEWDRDVAGFPWAETADPDR